MNSNQKTTFALPIEVTKKRKWFLLDATGKILGRFCSEVAKILSGKHRPDYTPHVDTGDGVIVIHADKIIMSGMKEARKEYHQYTGWIGGMKTISYREMKKQNPKFIIEHAVRGMVAKTKKGQHQMKRLRIFAGKEHGMEAQQPITVKI